MSIRGRQLRPQSVRNVMKNLSEVIYTSQNIRDAISCKEATKRTTIQATFQSNFAPATMPEFKREDCDIHLD